MKDYGMDIFAQCIGGKVVFVKMPLFIKSPEVRKSEPEEIIYTDCSKFMKLKKGYSVHAIPCSH
jgi:hypothetical protein